MARGHRDHTRIVAHKVEVIEGKVDHPVIDGDRVGDSMQGVGLRLLGHGDAKRRMQHHESDTDSTGHQCDGASHQS